MVEYALQVDINHLTQQTSCLICCVNIFTSYFTKLDIKRD